MSSTKAKLVAVLVIALVFVAGFALGMFSSHVMILRGGPGAARFPKLLIERLDRHLDLTDAQRTQVEEILRRRHARIDAVWSEARPRVRQEIERANQEIAAVLTPEQRAKFEKMPMRMHGRGGPHRPPPPPR